MASVSSRAILKGGGMTEERKSGLARARDILCGGSALVAAVGLAAAGGASPHPHESGIRSHEWGAITAPVYGSSEKAPYDAAELFAGPQKFGPNYFSGVLPNGRI